jgi:hypothetical protein
MSPRLAVKAQRWQSLARKSQDIQQRSSGVAQVHGSDSRFPACITDRLVRGRCAWRFETTSWGQSPRHHGKQKHSPDSLNIQASCEILTVGQSLMQRVEAKTGC